MVLKVLMVLLTKETPLEKIVRKYGIKRLW